MSRPDITGGGDPKPAPPREPAPEECCQLGCDPCVFDRYYEALERYHDALARWQECHPEEQNAPLGAAPT